MVQDVVKDQGGRAHSTPRDGRSIRPRTPSIVDRYTRVAWRVAAATAVLEFAPVVSHNSEAAMTPLIRRLSPSLALVFALSLAAARCAASPVVVFSTITGIIATLQYFTEAAVAATAAMGQATAGGGSVTSAFGTPEGSTFTYAMWLYMKGFRYKQMGYASAMSIVLFVVAFTVILIVLKRSKSFSGGSA